MSVAEREFDQDTLEEAIVEAIALLQNAGYVIKSPRAVPPDLVVRLPGAPRGKGRPRTRVVSNPGKPAFATMYPDPETKNYEAMLRYAGEQVMGSKPLYAGALRVRVNVLMPVPESWSGKKKQECLRGLIRPTGKPDWDNYAKVID